MAKDYYIVLGLESDATPEEIKEAFRRKAMELHPDHYGEDSGPFLLAQEAYSVLGDPKARREYDRIRRPVRRPTGRPEPLVPTEAEAEPLIPRRQRSADLGDVSLFDSFRSFSPTFEEIFDRLWRNFSEAVSPKSERLESLTIKIPLTPEQARRGGRARVLVPALIGCPSCHGHGEIGLYECWRCQGEGLLPVEQPISVAYPPGVTNDYVVRIALERFGIRNFYLTVYFGVGSVTE